MSWTIWKASLLATFVGSGAFAMSPGEVALVGGDPVADVTARGEGWRCGNSFTESPLPVGYPRPTAPGAIELKSYPSVRRAEVEGLGNARRGNTGFYPLFRHIQSRGISMTAPVEMDYGLQEVGEEDFSAPQTFRDDREGWRMSFLYENADLGPTGNAEDRVIVRDTEPVVVLSMGIRGGLTEGSLEAAEAALAAWLDGQDEWEATGGRRWMGYNGPSVPVSLRWWEVQWAVQRRAS